MRAKILRLVLLAAGCDGAKPLAIRCEQVSAAPPAIPAQRQAKLDELADLQVDLDLTVAREDQFNLKMAQQNYDGARKAYDDAARTHAKNLGFFMQMRNQEDDELQKALDRVASHRCNR